MLLAFTMPSCGASATQVLSLHEPGETAVTSFWPSSIPDSITAQRLSIPIERPRIPPRPSKRANAVERSADPIKKARKYHASLKKKRAQNRVSSQFVTDTKGSSQGRAGGTPLDLSLVSWDDSDDASENALESLTASAAGKFESLHLDNDAEDDDPARRVDPTSSDQKKSSETKGKKGKQKARKSSYKNGGAAPKRKPSPKVTEEKKSKRDHDLQNSNGMRGGAGLASPGLGTEAPSARSGRHTSSRVANQDSEEPNSLPSVGLPAIPIAVCFVGQFFRVRRC